MVTEIKINNLISVIINYAIIYNCIYLYISVNEQAISSIFGGMAFFMEERQ